MNKKWKSTKKTAKSSPVLFEDEEMSTASSDEVKPKSCTTPRSKRLTDHSTPIGNKGAIDSPELNYNESPIIEPLTQHPPSEVGWDYRQVLKDDEDGNPQVLMDTFTPKRSTSHLVSKKRNSNSPLLYKPVKKKLIQEQQKDERKDFMNVLKHLESTAKQKKDHDEVSKKTDSSAESQLVVDMEVVSDDSDMKLQVSANTDESPGQGKNEVAHAKNYNALLDDSIEHMMVLCSQEIEAKEFGNKKENQTTNTLYTIPESTESRNKSSEIFKNPAKENIQPPVSNDKMMNVSDISSRNSSKSSKSESFPDDSFDDFFVAIDDKDLCKGKEIVLGDKTKTVKTHTTSTTNNTVVKSSEQQKKFFQSKSSAQIATKSTTLPNSKFDKTNVNSKVFVQTKTVNENACYGYLNKDYVKTNSGSTFNSDTQNNTSASGARLLKAKSFSDSNFFQNNHHQAQNFDRSKSNINIDSMNYQKQNTHCFNQNSEGYGSSSSSESKGWRRTYSSSSIGQSQYSNVTRLTNSEGSQSTSTPAEIERKRQEAIARRQKKMNNAAQRRPLQLPLKR